MSAEVFRRTMICGTPESVFYLKYVRPLLENGPSMSSVQDERLKKMLTWLHQNLDKNISVAEIAQTANICPRECQRIFQQYLHYSPIEYLQRIRVFHAAELLTDSDCPITDIALNCGFSNPSYFSKQFKTIMGSRPREYRAASHNRIPIS